jgi:riboflavin biosynthesis pyrimidine reductase
VRAHPAADPRAADQEAPALLRRLRPAGEPIDPGEYVAELGLWSRAGEPSARPRTLLNMVSSADGRATVHGRSGSLSSRADQGLFHALRAPADAVLVGAGTVRTERYGRLIRDEATRELRISRGLAPEPLACVVSASLDLDPRIPLLAEPATRLMILTPSEHAMQDAAADVGYLRAVRNRQLDLGAALHGLAADFGVQLLLCEGGPHLAREMLGAALLDEIFLSISPRLGGGDPPHGAALRILAGAELEPPVELELLDTLEGDGHLFVHYAVVAPERVSWETTLSSSPAS